MVEGQFQSASGKKNEVKQGENVLVNNSGFLLETHQDILRPYFIISLHSNRIEVNFSHSACLFLKIKFIMPGIK
jgi:hypothetical protein